MADKFALIDPDTGIILNGWRVSAKAVKTSRAATLKRDAKRVAAGQRSRLDAEANARAIIVTETEFNQKYRRTKIVKNLMSGKDVEIEVNTPACCDPSTETYWSM